MDLAKTIFWPLDGKIIALEFIIRLALVGLYIFTKMTKPYILEVSNPEDWLYYAHPLTESPMISGICLYKLVTVYSFLSCALGLLYARLMLRVSARAMLSSFVFYSLAASLALVLTAVSTNVLKIFAGRMRPDYLNRCLPGLFMRDRLPHFSIYDTNGGVLAPFDRPRLQCDPSSVYDISDGSKSFPSGHSSYAASVAGVAALYLSKIIDQTPRHRLSVKSSLTVLVSLACVAFPAVIGTTRVLDRRHHPSDVIAGLALGALNGYLAGGLYFAEPFAIPQKVEPITAAAAPPQIKTISEASIEALPEKSLGPAFGRNLLTSC